MKRLFIAAAALFGAAAFATPASANLNVFACEPEWGALATEIGGDKVSVYTATVGGQDPHQVQARPSLIARARTANISVCTGAELEVGWLPLIIQQSGNNRIAPGQPGAFDATSAVRLMETPGQRRPLARRHPRRRQSPHPDRSAHSDPGIARLGAALCATRSGNAAAYTSRQQDFERRMDSRHRALGATCGALARGVHRRAAPCLGLSRKLARLA